MCYCENFAPLELLLDSDQTTKQKNKTRDPMSYKPEYEILIKTGRHFKACLLFLILSLTSNISCVKSNFLNPEVSDPYISLKRDSQPPLQHLEIVGTERLYAVYQPAFVGSEAYQVVLEIVLRHNSKEPNSLYQLDEGRTESTRYSLKPEVFGLEELLTLTQPLPLRTSFNATLYRGLFWEDGEPVLQDIQVNVKRVALQSKIQKNPESLPLLMYYTFGNDKELFAIHIMDGHTDFQHLIRLSIREGIFNRDQAIKIHDGKLMVFFEKTNNAYNARQIGSNERASVQLDGAYLPVSAEVFDGIFL